MKTGIRWGLDKKQANESCVGKVHENGIFGERREVLAG